ncbi:MAG: GNAT family N-acetyltransferase [Oligoflexia bacterium]|nr:GNAT family N-acetyltransferase [Oligoflexia bacterium]
MQVRFAAKTDKTIISNFLHQEMSSAISVEQWSNLFRPSSENLATEYQNFGTLVEEQGKLAGFMGCIYSSRFFGEKKYIISQISSICVAKEFRGRGIAKKLMNLAIDRPGLITIGQSPTQHMVEAYLRMGLNILDEYIYEIPKTSNKKHFELVPFDEANKQLLPESQTLFHWHKQWDSRIIFIKIETQLLGLILKDYQTKSGKKYAHLMYATDYALLTNHIDALTSQLTKEEDHFLAIDSRFITKPINSSWLVKLKTPRIYRSEFNLPKHFYDSLYSEAFVLNVRI